MNNIGDYSVRFGNNTNVTGSSSFVAGNNSSVSGSYSGTIGNSNNVSGSNTFVVGSNNSIWGSYSLVSGYSNSAGNYAHVGGYHAMAYGYYSFVSGYNTLADSYAQVVFGRYNVTEESLGVDWSDWQWVANEPLFVIGNGSSSSARANAVTVLKNGNVGIGPYNPTHRLEVGSSGDGTNAIANSWQTFSDRRYKTNIHEIENSLDKVLSLQGVYFDWKKTGQPAIGFIAQDVRTVLPEIVAEDANGYLSVDYSKVVPVLVEAIKEQNKNITANKSNIGNVSGELLTTQDKVDNNLSFIKLLQKAFEFKNNIISIMQEAVFKNKVSFVSTVEFNSGNIYMANNRAGYAVISAGQNKVHVKFTKKFKDVPIVNITPMTALQNNTYYVTNVSVNGFDIVLLNTSTKDIRFSWSVVLVHNPVVSKSIATSTPPISTPTPPTSTPTVSPTSTITPTEEPDNITPSPTQEQTQGGDTSVTPTVEDSAE